MTFNDIFNTLVNAIRPPIGAFNELVFEVSTEKVITYDNYKRETKARYARHELINQTSVLEYLGRDLEEITFTMMFTVSLGVDPAEETSKLRRMCLDGVADYLILGNTVVGMIFTSRKSAVISSVMFPSPPEHILPSSHSRLRQSSCRNGQPPF